MWGKSRKNNQKKYVTVISLVFVFVITGAWGIIRSQNNINCTEVMTSSNKLITDGKYQSAYSELKLHEKNCVNSDGKYAVKTGQQSNIRELNTIMYISTLANASNAKGDKPQTVLYANQAIHLLNMVPDEVRQNDTKMMNIWRRMLHLLLINSPTVTSED